MLGPPPQRIGKIGKREPEMANSNAVRLANKAAALKRHLQEVQKMHDDVVKDIKKTCTHQYADGKSAVFNGWAFDECRICGQALNGGDVGWA